jgi:pimeloyl-ACP methyl ester carboxylesterase
MWRHQLDGLTEDFRVLALDLPAHGALADIPFRLADASAAVASVIRDLPGGRAIIVGQSLGGYVGMDVAAREPGLVAGLVLASATAEPRYIVRRAPRAVGSYLATALGERLLPAAKAPSAAASASADGSTPPATNGWLFKGGTRALLRALRESFLPRLAAYPGPTLIINGVDDELFRGEERRFLGHAQRGRLEVISGTGHLVAEEQPEAFNHVVRQFALDVFGRDPAPLGPAAGAGAAVAVAPTAGSLRGH